MPGIASYDLSKLTRACFLLHQFYCNQFELEKKSSLILLEACYTIDSKKTKLTKQVKIR
jgi:hypothetical protein